MVTSLFSSKYYDVVYFGKILQLPSKFAEKFKENVKIKELLKETQIIMYNESVNNN
jgi:hypothetical protein